MISSYISIYWNYAKLQNSALFQQLTYKRENSAQFGVNPLCLNWLLLVSHCMTLFSHRCELGIVHSSPDLLECTAAFNSSLWGGRPREKLQVGDEAPWRCCLVASRSILKPFLYGLVQDILFCLDGPEQLIIQNQIMQKNLSSFKMLCKFWNCHLKKNIFFLFVTICVDYYL